MDEIDKLLASLQSKPPATPPVTPSSIPQETNAVEKPPRSIEDLLAQLSETSKQHVRDRLTSPAPSHDSLPPPPDLPPPPVAPPQPLLETVKDYYQEHDREQQRLQAEQQRIAHEQQQQQQREAEQRRAQLRENRRQALVNSANTWLKHLDPQSKEGLWFEEFACHYPSRLEAAIEYLEALQEVDRELRGS